MADLRNNASVVDLGSGIAKWIEVDEDGASTGTAYTFPWIKSAKLSDTTDEVEIESDGEASFTDTGKRKVALELVVMQKDKESLKWVVETMRGKRVQIFKQISDKAINGYYQYWLGAICKVIPSAEIPIGKGTEMTWKFSLEPVEAEGESGGGLVVDCSIFDGGFKKNISGSLSFSSSGLQYWDILKIAE